ncbi:MAG: histidine kinase, partial [Treponema sp.]|nr:histidine kinase [Treponema sp.]
EYNKKAASQIILGAAISDEQNVINGYLLFIIDAESIRPILYAATSYVITDSYGTVFTASSPRYKDRFNRLPEEYRHGLGFYYLATEAAYHTYGGGRLFDIYTFVNSERLKQTAMLMAVMVLLLLAVMIRGLFFGAQRLSESKTKTVDIIVDACRNVENGDLTKRLAIESNIEFQTIANAFNDMIENVKTLLEENKKEIHEKYLAELKQLEQQFNPHFLFNTLETIKFLIKLDPDKAQKTIVNLSSLLRYTINNEISEVELEEDMRYIENYLYILTMRFGSRFSYSIDVPVSIRDCLVPKMILQPLIGNAVKYGCNDCESVELSITARAVAGKLYLTVKDTGRGMDKAQLKEIRQLIKSETNTSNHIGLFNVQRRVQLMYGASYGLKIDSTQGVGTIARICLPCIRGVK